MHKMGLEAVYQEPNTNRANKQHKVYPYLLWNVPIEHSYQVCVTTLSITITEDSTALLMAKHPGKFKRQKVPDGGMSDDCVSTVIHTTGKKAFQGEYV